MAKLVVPPEQRFTQQAKVHQDIQSALQDFITRFTIQHDEIVSKLDPRQAAQFTQWWNNLSACVSEHATLHEQLALHLTNAGQSYYQLDGKIAQTFEP